MVNLHTAKNESKNDITFWDFWHFIVHVQLKPSETDVAFSPNQMDFHVSTQMTKSGNIVVFGLLGMNRRFGSISIDH